MTTIISDGYYLVADHRTTTNVSSLELYSKDTGENIIDYKSNLCNKIMFPPIDIHTDFGKIKAYSYAGDLEILSSFIGILKEHNSPSGFKLCRGSATLTTICKTVPDDESGYILAITDENHTVKITFTKDKLSVTIYKPGTLIAVGSGGKIFDSIVNLLKAAPQIRYAIPIISFIDENTSYTYSAYSVEENHLFTNIEISLDEVKEHSNCIVNVFKEKLGI